MVSITLNAGHSRTAGLGWLRSVLNLTTASPSLKTPSSIPVHLFKRSSGDKLRHGHGVCIRTSFLNSVGLHVGRDYISKLPLHPSDPEKGNRVFKVKTSGGSTSLLLSKNDLKILEVGRTVRLMGLFNITIKNIGTYVEADFHSDAYGEARKINAPLIHWLPYGTGIETSIIMPDASTLSGLAEDYCRTLKLGDIIQFERFGFVRLDSVIDDKIVAYYTHR